jgi:hypothetical protein
MDVKIDKYEFLDDFLKFAEKYQDKMMPHVFCGAVVQVITKVLLGIGIHGKSIDGLISQSVKEGTKWNLQEMNETKMPVMKGEENE